MNNYSNNFPLEYDSDEPARQFDSTYNTYPPIYADCPIQPKVEPTSCNYWQIASPTATTHNILDATPMDSFHVQNFDPSNSAYSSSLGYQHPNFCEPIAFFPTPYNEPTNWQDSNNYQLLTTNYYNQTNPSSFCPTQNQCIPSNSSVYVNKIESSFSGSPPSYFESSNSPNHSQERIVDESINWSRSQTSSLTTISSIPPRNPLNGMYN